MGNARTVLYIRDAFRECRSRVTKAAGVLPTKSVIVYVDRTTSSLGYSAWAGRHINASGRDKPPLGALTPTVMVAASDLGQRVRASLSVGLTWTSTQ